MSKTYVYLQPAMNWKTSTYYNLKSILIVAVFFIALFTTLAVMVFMSYKAISSNTVNRTEEIDGKITSKILSLV